MFSFSSFLLLSNFDEDLFFREPNLLERSVVAAWRPVPSSGNNDCAQALLVQAKNFVVLLWFDAFHRASINAEQRGAGQEVAQRDIDLPRRPVIDVEPVAPLPHKIDHHIGLRCSAFHFEMILTPVL